MKKTNRTGSRNTNNFTEKLHNKRLNGDVQILIAVDRFSKWPTVKTCKTAESREVLNFLTKYFNPYGIPEKIKSDKGEPLFQKNTNNFVKSET